MMQVMDMIFTKSMEFDSFVDYGYGNYLSRKLRVKAITELKVHHFNYTNTVQEKKFIAFI